LENEELADTPSVRELYTIIMTLATKCNELETKMQALNKWAHITKKKLHITDWLNTTEPKGLAYDDWVAAFNVLPTDLDVLFETDYVGGVMEFLKQQLTLRPLRAFTSKANTFYIFKEKWIMCEEETFTKLMYLLDQQFMREFIAWQTANKHRMATDDSFSEKYARNLKKMMGGTFTRAQLYSRIKRELYVHLRSDPPNIMEYETTF
jgi:hypothetical protein